MSFDNNTLSPCQENLRSADFSTTLTVFGLKPRSGENDRLIECVYPSSDRFRSTLQEVAVICLAAFNKEQSHSSGYTWLNYPLVDG